MKVRRHNWVVTVPYVLLLASVALHFYRAPEWDTDMLGYMGNALLNEETNVVRLHQRVYAEIAKLPAGSQQLIVNGDSERRDRALNPLHFAEFLPCFAIRPMYNLTIYGIYRGGMALRNAIALISSLSYLFLGLLVYFWMTRYVASTIAAIATLLIMLTPPIMILGRYTGADGISTALALLSLYLIFERNLLLAGIGLLLVSVFFRTDNVVLAGPALIALWAQKRIDLWKAATLGMIAVLSVLVINHAAGDYGLQMLYYRNFVAAPFAPAEISAHFSAGQYLSAFRAGFRVMLESYITLFFLLGAVAFLLNRRHRALILVVTSYVVLHYITLPNWMDRWFGVFYLTLAVMAVAGLDPVTSVLAHGTKHQS
jgi:hypothetical protein